MITVPSFISHLRTMADGSLRIQLDTRELPPSKVAELYSQMKTEGIFAFAASRDEFTEQEREMLNVAEKSINKERTQSLSKDLRDSLYKLWKSDESSCGDFEDFYEDKMEKMIEQILRRSQK